MIQGWILHQYLEDLLSQTTSTIIQYLIPHAKYTLSILTPHQTAV